MISSNQQPISPKANRIKNFIIVFGVCLSLFTISSFDNWISVTQASVVQEIQELKDSKTEELPNNIEEICITQHEPKLKTHHNFIASYLLQESSFERKNKKSKEQGGFLSHLKQLHKIIITQTLGLF
ncbi:MAG: hypothetical protein KAI99_03715 [Cyclobacteriaceae bacterium]|nr:hypothetical protein [Cyclobacteriaceae bacterium]